MKAIDYNWKIDSKYDKVYQAELIQKQIGTIGSSPISKGETVSVTIATSPSGFKMVYGVTSDGRDYSCEYSEVKEHLKMLKIDRSKTPDQVILEAIQTHNDRVF